MRQLRALVAVAAAAVAMATALPAAAHEPWDDGSIPPPPPASASDGYSKDMHLLSTSAHTGGVNSDLAFKGSLAFAGHYGGFRVIDLAEPGSPVELADVHCNGPQGDVTIHGDLLFLSVDTPQSTEACEGSRNVTASTPGAFEGIRVFDISDPADPTFVQAVRTDCGSHTNTLVPGEGDTAYVYVASYPLSASNIGPDCQAPFERISVIQVDGDDAVAGAGARVVAEPTIKGVDYFGAAYGVTPFYACHDITVLGSEEDRGRRLPLAGTAVGHLQPAPAGRHRRHRHHRRRHLALGRVHSGREVRHLRRRVLRPRQGALRCAVDLRGRRPVHGSQPLPDPWSEPNTYHNFNYVPLADRYVLVSSAYGSGTSVVDLTDPAAPKEIAFYDMRSNQWSTYFYNGLIVANDISRGVDTLRLSNKAVAVPRSCRCSTRRRRTT